MANLRFLSSNARGLAETTKRKQVFNYLREKKLDVIFLQETHSNKKLVKIWRNQWGGTAIFSHGTSNARGVCILFARNLEIQTEWVKIDEEGRWIICKVTIDNVSCLLVNIYAPVW